MKVEAVSCWAQFFFTVQPSRPLCFSVLVHVSSQTYGFLRFIMNFLRVFLSGFLTGFSTGFLKVFRRVFLRGFLRGFVKRDTLVQLKSDQTAQ